MLSSEQSPEACRTCIHYKRNHPAKLQDDLQQKCHNGSAPNA